MKKPFDLMVRTRLFAKNVGEYVSKLPRTAANANSSTQLIRSSSSVAANYLEAVDNLGRRDFLMKLRIARREARESELWLDLSICNQDQLQPKQELRAEAEELVKILGAMIRKADAGPR